MGTHNLAKTSDEKRQAIRSLLARGMTIKAITEAVKCSSHTVTAVREMDAEPIGEEQAILARKWNNVGQLAVEQIQERLAEGEKPTLQQLSIVGAVAADKMLALKGEPTARVVHERADSAAELKEMLKEALEAGKMKAAAVDVGAESGAGAKKALVAGGNVDRAGACEASGQTRDTFKQQHEGGRGGSTDGRSLYKQNDSPSEKISPNED